MKNYFPHDYGARIRLRELRMKFGLDGLGFYWCLVELLHEEGGYIKESDIESIAFDLQYNSENASKIIKNSGLFVVKKGKIHSDRVLRNLKKREEISEARKTAAVARWGEKEKTVEEMELSKEEKELDPIEAKAFYINSIENAFNKFLDSADLEDLRVTNIYDYKSLFDAVVEDVKSRDFLTINNKKIPVFKFLETIQNTVRNNDIMNLKQVIKDVQERYLQGKVKNRSQYLISALYNSANLTMTNCEGTND